MHISSPLKQILMEVAQLSDRIDISDVDGIAKGLVELGIPVSPILAEAGITSIPTEVFGGLEELGESQLRTIEFLCAIVDRRYYSPLSRLY